jgi:hypothetical protein
MTIVIVPERVLAQPPKKQTADKHTKRIKEQTKFLIFCIKTPKKNTLSRDKVHAEKDRKKIRLKSTPLHPLKKVRYCALRQVFRLKITVLFAPYLPKNSGLATVKTAAGAVWLLTMASLLNGLTLFVRTVKSLEI